MIYFAPLNASLRLRYERIVTVEFIFFFKLFNIISESFKRYSSISNNANSKYYKESTVIQSPKTFLANTVLPAPKKVILFIIYTPFNNKLFTKIFLNYLTSKLISIEIL